MSPLSFGASCDARDNEFFTSTHAYDFEDDLVARYMDLNSHTPEVFNSGPVYAPWVPTPVSFTEDIDMICLNMADAGMDAFINYDLCSSYSC